ncbi:unnamed protein product [Rotaria magnacalcarata]|uniref:G-protein coupled receptors family 1 profile domain-containing protein n=2 Tax=Rotaria magnacalcarata TaxID=392030 RepID=A0A815YTT1_9BILA|nr:unnamed protein product [Rotaria magnacalcarata]CAF2087429.1 unnamed protein product [Rotaria magnacalcarata]CAF3856008.1 unnamed protein product [Rotaria magnacalcarata]
MFLSKESVNPRILCNVLAPIFICGFLGNIICIIVFLRRRFRTRSISVYFVALFFNDCLLLFISHIAKMLIFDASSSCWFNIFLSKFIDIIYYREMIYRQGLAVLTYNTTYTQISMLIFMFMSIQRVRTFSSISYRESRMCALMLTLIAFVYGIIVSYMQLYDAFCIEELNLTETQSLEIDLLINNTRSLTNTKCTTTATTTTTTTTNTAIVVTDVINNFVTNTTTHVPRSVAFTSTIFSILTSTISTYNYQQTPLSSTINNNNNSIDVNSNSMCYSETDWYRIRHRAIAYVYLQSYMSIDWPDEHAQRSACHLEIILPPYLLTSIHNLTWPLLKSRPGKDYFHEHQFCTQAYHFIGSYANCSFRLSPTTFRNWYKFLYDRRLSLTNRYTIGFIIGTFIPSCICVISSFICLYCIANRPSIRKHSHSRAELRSLSLILVEILLSLLNALQSYIINFFTCHRLLFRMESDNCYGQSSNNILPNFLGSILELFTSTSNILILMICGAQFRNELTEILNLKNCFPRKQQYQQANLSSQHKRIHKHSRINPPHHIVSSLLSLQNGKSKLDILEEPSIDSIITSFHNKEYISISEVEQPSDETSQYYVKSTTV